VKVIAAVGRNASGKDELADYLHRRCAVPVLVSGDVARNMAEERGVEPTRANLHRLSRQAIAEHGPDFFMQSLIDEIIENNTTLEAFHQRIEETLIRPVLADEVGCGEGV